MKSSWIHSLWENCLARMDEVKTRSNHSRQFNARRAHDTELQIGSLEPRVLFSAAPIDASALQNAEAEIADVNVAELDEQPRATTSIFESEAVREIVVVDAGVDSLAEVLDDLSRNRPEAAVYVLDSERDGVEQISEWLDEHHEIESLHIVSHGSEGSVQLGSTSLSEQNLAGYAGQIALWQNALASEADILFYGCDLAGSQQGEQFVASIAALTGADVAASTDETGHEQIGGDWDLEFGLGEVETQVAFSQQFQQHWMSTLVSSNQAPVNVGPSIGRTPVDTDLVFSTSTSNAFEITDSDAGTEDLQVTLDVTNGTISLNGSAPLVLNVGLGAGDTQTQFTGTLAEINAALDGLTFTPDAGFVGRASLTITTNDLGSGAGVGAALQDTDVYAIHVGQQLSSTGDILVNPRNPEDPTNSTETTATDSLGGIRSVATHDDGSYVVVWTDDDRNDSHDVFAQRFDSTGNKIGSSFQVNGSSAGSQASASVAMDGQGRFAVVWRGVDSDGNGIFMRRFEADGTNIDPNDVLVNASEDFDQTDPAIAVNDDGKIVVAWQEKGGPDDGIHANTFTMTGSAGSTPILVREHADATAPTVDINSKGDFIVVWQENGISYRRYGSQADAGPVQANSSSASKEPTVAYQNDGRFLIAWRSDEFSDALKLQGFSAAGVSGSELHLDTGTISAFSRQVSLDSDHEGNYLMVWRRGLRDDEVAISRLGLNVTNDIEMSEIAYVNSDRQSGNQRNASVSMNDMHNFVVAWTQSDDSEAGDVYVRQFGTHFDTMIGLTTQGEVSSSFGSHDAGTVISLSGSLQIGDGVATQGTLDEVYDAFRFTDPDVGVNAMHVVTQDMVIGRGTNRVQLSKGDHLISFSGSTAVGGGDTVQANDIVVFRPNFPNDYSNGQFFVLYDNLQDATHLPTMTDVRAMTLIERDTLIGDTTVNAGDLLFVSDSDDRNVWVWRTDDLAGSTSGTVEKLISGNEIGIDHAIEALELIEQDVTIGGAQLQSGQLLLSLNADDSVGENSVSANKEDVFALTVAATHRGSGFTYATATQVIDGSDIEFNTSDEQIQSLALYSSQVAQSNQSPTLISDPQSPTAIEQSASVNLFSGTHIALGDVGDDVLSVEVTVANLQNGSDERLTIDGTEVALATGVFNTANNGFSVNVSVTGSTAVVTITRGVGFSAADAEVLVDSLQYSIQADDPLGSTRDITLSQIRDTGGTPGVDTSSPNIVSQVSITAVNDPPSVTSTPANPTINSTSAVPLFNSTSLSTIESGQSLRELVFEVSGIANPGDESLSIDGTSVLLDDGNINTSNGYSVAVSVTGASATVTITRSGNFSANEAESLIDGMSYQIDSLDPLGSSRTVAIASLSDTGGTLDGGNDTTSLNLASNITVVAVNDPPVLTANAVNPTFTENGTSVGLFSGANVDLVEAADRTKTLVLNVSNVENGADEFVHIDGQAVALSSGSLTTAANGFGVNVALASGAATITITHGSDFTASEAEALINGLQYSSTSDEFQVASRTVQVRSIQDDGGTDFSGVDQTLVNLDSVVTLRNVNDAPVVTATASNPVFTENGSVVTLFQSTSVQPVEANDQISRIQFQFSGLESGGDEVIVVDGETIHLVNGNTNTSANGFDVSISVSGTDATIEITRSAAITAADAETVIDEIAYGSTLNEHLLSKAMRLVSVTDNGATAHGGDDTAMVNLDSSITIQAVNDPTDVALTAANPSFIEAGPAVQIYSAVTLTSPETADRVQEIQLRAQGLLDGINERLRVDGQFITLQTGSTTTASNGYQVDVTKTGNNADVVITKVGNLAMAEAESLISGFAYENTSTTPNEINRTFRLVSLQDSGGTSNGGQDLTTVNVDSVVNVTAINTAPTVSVAADGPHYVEGSGGVNPFSSAAVNTVEVGQSIREITFQLSDIENASQEKLVVDGEVISLLSGTTTTTAGSYVVDVTTVGSESTIRITKSGGFSSTNAEVLINSLQYDYISEDPQGASRTIQLVSVQDSGGGSDTTVLNLDSVITLEAVNDPPFLLTTPTDPSFADGGSPVSVFSSTVITTIESADLLRELVVSVHDVQDASSEFLRIDGQEVTLANGTSTVTPSGYDVSVSVAGSTSNVTITRTGHFTANEASALINALGYRASGTIVQGQTRTVELTSLSDTGGGNDTRLVGRSSTVTFDNTNNQPVVSAFGFNTTYTEGNSAQRLFNVPSIDLIEASDRIQMIEITGSNLSDGVHEALVIDGETISLQTGTTTTSASGLTVSVVSGATTTIQISKAGGIAVADGQSLLNSVAYQHLGEDPTVTSRQFTFTKLQDDGGAPGGLDTAVPNAVATVNVVPVNDPPVLSADGLDPTFTENGAPVALFDNIDVNLIESADHVRILRLVVEGSADPGNEYLTIDGTQVGLLTGTHTTTNGYAVTTERTSPGANTIVRIEKTGDYSAAEAETLLAGMTYHYDSENPETTIRTIAITGIRDSGGDAGAGNDTTIVSSIESKVAIQPTNDSPVISDAVLDAVFDNDTNPSGESVQSLFAAGFTDLDNDSFQGIVVISDAAKASEGTWQYSTDGTNWADIGAVSESSALVLSSDTRLRFLPERHFEGDPGTLVVRGIDSTAPSAASSTSAGENRVTINASNPTAGSPLSNEAKLSTEVAIFNFAPEISGVVNTGITDQQSANPFRDIVIYEDNLQELEALVRLAGGDANGGFTDASLAIAGFQKTSAGIYQSISPMDDAALQVALRQLVFVPTDNQVAVGDTQNTRIRLTVSDGFVNTSNQQTVVTTLSVNDSPVAVDTFLQSIDEDNYKSSGGSIVDLMSASYDVDFADGVEGIVITSNKANPDTEGVWQYSTNGKIWRDVGEVSRKSGLALASDVDGATRLRFVPVENFNGSVTPLEFYVMDELYTEAYSSTNPRTESHVLIDTTQNAVGGELSLASARIETLVQPVNDAPTLRTLTRTVTSGETLEVDAGIFERASNDVENDPLTAVLVTDSGPQNGTLTLNADGSFTYVPDQGFVGVDSFQWQAFDGQDLSAPTTVFLNVIPLTVDTGASESASTEAADDGDAEPTIDATEDATSDSNNPAPNGLTGSSEAAADLEDSNATLGDGESNQATQGVINLIAGNDNEERASIFFSPINSTVFERRAGYEADGSLGVQESSDWNTLDESIAAFRASYTMEASDYALLTSSGELWKEWDAARGEVESQLHQDMLKIGTTSFAASGFTVGFVAWAIRSGFLLSSFLAQMPAWRSIDPLLIMQGFGDLDGEETLEQMMQRESESLETGVSEEVLA